MRSAPAPVSVLASALALALLCIQFCCSSSSASSRSAADEAADAEGLLAGNVTLSPELEAQDRRLQQCARSEVVVAAVENAPRFRRRLNSAEAPPTLIDTIFAVFGSFYEVLDMPVEVASPIEACSPLEGVDARGKILLVKRGACFFSTKAYYGEQVGAAAVIVYDDGRGGADFGAMGCPTENHYPEDYEICTQIIIPVFFVWYTSEVQNLVWNYRDYSLSIACPWRYATPEPTYQPTPWPTTMRTRSPTPRPTRSSVPTLTPTEYPTLWPTVRPTAYPTYKPSFKPTVVPTVAPTPKPSVRPTPQPTAFPTLAPTQVPTAWPTVRPTTLAPSQAPTSVPTYSPTAAPSAAPTQAPSARPTAAPTVTLQPTAQPTPPPGAPTNAPTPPTFAPSFAPTAAPTARPTATPSAAPTRAPSFAPTATPTLVPTAEPTQRPTALPTATPTYAPSTSPTAVPTLQPSLAPTAVPTNAPTWAPSFIPTAAPTGFPTLQPTGFPTQYPTDAPTTSPTKHPTAVPTPLPTAAPSAAPTWSPTESPTLQPTEKPATTTTTTTRTTTWPQSTIAPDEPSVEVHGEMVLSAPPSFAESSNLSYALRVAIAQHAGVAPSNVQVNITVKTTRNSFRRLQMDDGSSVEVLASFVIVTGLTWGLDVEARLSDVEPNLVASEIGQAMADIGRDWVVVEVESISDFASDCVWNPWEEWSSCDVACGGETRQRSLRSRRNASDATPCADAAVEQRGCPGNPECPTCSAGFYLYVTRWTYKCVECDYGTSRASPGGRGPDACTPCQAGSYAAYRGQTNCTACGAGRYGIREGATYEQCYRCSQGRSSADLIRGAVSGTACDACQAGKYADNSGMTACKPCGAGYYTSLEGLRSQAFCMKCPQGTGDGPEVATSQTQCPLCRPGRFAAAAGLAICSECEPGRSVSTTGATICNQCESGAYAAKHGSINCTLCDPGTYIDTPGKAKCLLCKEGRYAESFGTKVCTECERGRTAAGKGAAMCDNCSAGSSSLSGASACFSCQAGTYAFEGDPSCSSCARGRFSPTVGIGSCPLCAPGDYASQTGRTSCMTCLPGTFSHAGAPTCSQCAVMTYTATAGNPTCAQCPLGEVSSLPGQSECTSCSLGRYHPGGNVTSTCSDCPPGTYSSSEGSSVCVKCPMGKFNRQFGATSSMACKECPNGRYGDELGLNTCKACPAGTLFAGDGASSRSQCASCVPGKFSREGSWKCTNCSLGSSSDSGAASCSVCVPGRFSSYDGMPSCATCSAGRFVNRSGATACEDCFKGTYRDTSVPGDACEPCPAGRFVDVRGAADLDRCLACPAGRFNDQVGRSVCEMCWSNTFNMREGRSSPCEPCGSGSFTPSGALACCPTHDDLGWPVAPQGSLQTLPGKSETGMYVVPSCDVAASVPYASRTYVREDTLFVPSEGGSQLALTVGSAETCRVVQCGSSACLVAVRAQRTIFQPGESLELVAFVSTANATEPLSSSGTYTGYDTEHIFHDGQNFQSCSAPAGVVLVGFGCSPETLSYFFVAMTSVVILTILGGLCIEVSERSRLIVLVECSIEVVVPAGAPMPSRRTLRDEVARGLGIKVDDLPYGSFSASIVTPPGAAARKQKLRIEFGVRAARGDHEAVRQQLLQTTWEPGSGASPWASAEISVQPPNLIKAAGKAPGMDLILLIERAALICLGGVEEEDEDERYLHKAVAHELLERFTSRVSIFLLTLQCIANLGAAGGLPVWAFLIMDSCAVGYPSSVHFAWLAYVMASSLVNILLVWLIGGPVAGKFLWKFRMRLLMRVLFMSVMLTDTYQDATFPVIAYTCGFDLWFVSAWLVVLGVLVMQFCAQLLALAHCVYGYWRARTPEERERHFVQGIFLVLRGSDNLVLSYVLRPAVEERLGGASSWAMKTSEARIAFFRFLFEDVEQSALQVVFIMFYEDAAMTDKLWVISSVATSLSLSFTIVVQCLPEVRDWIWHRVLAAFPSGRTVPLLRAFWLLLCLCLYRLVSAFPWISACSPSGESCEYGFTWWRSHCINGESYLFGYPTRYEVAREVMVASGFSVLGMASTIACVALACFIWRRRRRALEPRKGHGGEAYALEHRFAICRGEGEGVEGEDFHDLRPKSSEDDDAWLPPARQLRTLVANAAGAGAASEASLAPLLKLVETIDAKTFRQSRAHLSSFSTRGSWLRRCLERRSDNELPGLAKKLVNAPELQGLGHTAQVLARTLVVEAHHAWRIAHVRKNAAYLLSSQSFVQANLAEKAALVSEATGGLAPLLFVHWTAIETLGELPKCGVPGGSLSVPDTLAKTRTRLGLASEERAASCLVPFFLSHRWLRTTGPRSHHHPDSEGHVKARRLVSFARWFEALARKRGLRCDVVFWIDWCCSDQVDLKRGEVSVAALPLYIASCLKVIAWHTPDFESRCWTMVERVLAYSFCVGGLAPYVFDETFRLDDEESEAYDGSLEEVASSPRHSPTNRASALRSSADGDLNAKVVAEHREESVFDVDETHEGVRALSPKRSLGDVTTGGSDGPSTPVAASAPIFIGDAGAPDDADAGAPDDAGEDGSRDPGDVKVEVETEPTLSIPDHGPRRSEKYDRGCFGVAVSRRPRKLPNPLDFEACQVSREADRLLVAHLVDVALAVPALEVFADRQPVEWGLTEVIEQSLVSREPLPARLGKHEQIPEGGWLKPARREAPRQWRLVVRRARDLNTGMGASARDDAAAVIWVDSSPGEPGLEGTDAPPPTPDEIDSLFDAADPALTAAVYGRPDKDGSGASKIRALIVALKADLTAAIASTDLDLISAAVVRAREVEMAERQVAVDILCQDRLEAALASSSESVMRGALGTARASGAVHLPIFADVARVQRQLYELQLKERLTQQLEQGRTDGDIHALAAVKRVCDRHGLTELETSAAAAALELLASLRAAKDPPAILELQRSATDAGWSALAADAAWAAEDASMMLAIDGASEANSLSALRAVEARARAEHREEVEALAAAAIKECAGRIGDQLGLPAEWDVVLSLAGPTARVAGLLKKTEEKEAGLLETIQKMVDETYMGWGGLGKATRTRDRASEAIAKRLVVKSVVHVQNAENYVNFRSRRAQVRAECPDGMRTTWDVKTCTVPLTGVGRHKSNPVDHNINEYYLWHGTTPHGAACITDSDFELKRAGSAYGALFGAGIYFAESSMKSDEYTKADTRDWRPFILCRVVLGNIMYCDARDPVPIRKELEAACRPGGPGFHSVLGDREKVRKTFREFVVYDNHQVYPEYIVWYKREF